MLPSIPEKPFDAPISRIIVVSSAFWSSDIFFAKFLNDRLHKFVQTLDASTLYHSNPIINRMNWTTICKHSHGRWNLFQTTMTLLTNWISSLCKVRAILFHSMSNAQEQTRYSDSHQNSHSLACHDRFSCSNEMQDDQTLNLPTSASYFPSCLQRKQSTFQVHRPHTNTSPQQNIEQECSSTMKTITNNMSTHIFEQKFVET